MGTIGVLLMLLARFRRHLPVHCWAVFSPLLAELIMLQVANGHREALPTYWPASVKNLIAACWDVFSLLLAANAMP
jgi:hypothetical protein